MEVTDMKKIYQSPKIDVVKIQTVRMMAGSNPEDFNPTPNETSGTGSDALVKGGMFWSDDEPEEEYAKW